MDFHQIASSLVSDKECTCSAYTIILQRLSVHKAATKELVFQQIFAHVTLAGLEAPVVKVYYASYMYHSKCICA